MERIYVDLFIAWWISLRKGDAPSRIQSKDAGCTRPLNALGFITCK
jgi:hypothetical protein